MYFDPGTGSMLIQILIGAIPVIGAFFIGLRKKIFKKKGDNAPTEQPPADGSPLPEETKANDTFEEIDDD